MAPTGGSTGPAGDRAGAAVLRAVLYVLLSTWRLSLPEAAAVLGVAPRTLLAWRDDPGAAELDPVVRERLARLVRLHKALRARHPGLDAQRGWLRAGDHDGRTRLDRLRSGRIDAVTALCRELEADGHGGAGPRSPG